MNVFYPNEHMRLYVRTQTPRMAYVRLYTLLPRAVVDVLAGDWVPLAKVNAELKPLPYFARELRARIRGSFDELVHEPKRDQSRPVLIAQQKIQHVWVSYIVRTSHKVLSAVVLA